MLVLLGAGGLVASCARSPKSPNPDPGNRRLHKLAADPILARLPPGAVRTGWQEHPYERRTDGPFFGGGGWDGGSVTMTFTSTRSVREVYQFYAEQANETGWSPGQQVPMGTGTWSKHIDGKRCIIRLSVDGYVPSGILTKSGTSRSYVLTGGV